MRHVLAPNALVGIAAAAFPPFWNLILHGQTTAIPLIAFGAGAIAIAHNRKILAASRSACC
jgi:hypothetical protein